MSEAVQVLSRYNQYKGSVNPFDMGQIISSLSHELRVPLSVLSSNLELLKSNAFHSNKELQAETFLLCEEAIESLMRFLDDVKFLDTANKGELKIETSLFSVEKLIEKIMDQPNRLFYKTNRVKIRTDLTEPFFCTDEKLLSRAISGLIDNAIRFSTQEVGVKFVGNGSGLNIEVCDGGYGIPANEAERIFEPFYRCSNVKMISGNGLGLSIAKKATTCLKGSISIESEILKGTKVKLIIPTNDC
jgi:K+-sensing histidine kinase KdpD